MSRFRPAWLFGNKVDLYNTMFYFEPHYAVWRYVKFVNGSRDLEVTASEIEHHFDISPQLTRIVIFDLVSNHSLKRQDGLEDFPIYISNEPFKFPRRRRIRSIFFEYDSIRKETGVDRYKALRAILRRPQYLRTRSFQSSE